MPGLVRQRQSPRRAEPSAGAPGGEVGPVVAVGATGAGGAGRGLVVARAVGGDAEARPQLGDGGSERVGWIDDTWKGAAVISELRAGLSSLHAGLVVHAAHTSADDGNPMPSVS